MIKTDELRGIIAMRGMSQRKVAQHLGISEKTFYERMKKGVFPSDEIEQMIFLLKIEKPLEIFLPVMVRSAQHGNTIGNLHHARCRG